VNGSDMTVQSYETIVCERAGSAESIAIIALNRPTRANAMTPKMAEELGLACRDCLVDPSVKAIVLTGKGKHFCPGLDANDARDLAARIAKGIHPAEPYDGNLRRLHQATLAIYNATKPIIAAVNGAAAAGGLDIALACDYRLAATTARFSESYIKLGLPPLNGGAWLLRRVVGDSTALRMISTGEVLDADAALGIGLVDELHASDVLLDKAIAFAEQVSTAPAAVIEFIKREFRTKGRLEDALARVFVAGIGFSRSEAFKSGSEQIPDRKAASKASETNEPRP
jgi:enoyl-CoA hydratase/carnithine racemase